MSEPIGWIKFWKPKDDWYYLESTERQAYLDAYANVVARASEQGARLVGTYKCRGQSQWARFELWEFPDLQAVVDLTNALEEIGHFQYFAEENTIGRRYERRGDPQSWVI
jgi:hypothetical protein